MNTFVMTYQRDVLNVATQLFGMYNISFTLDQSQIVCKLWLSGVRSAGCVRAHYNNLGGRWDRKKRMVMVHAYLPGNEDCHAARAP